MASPAGKKLAKRGGKNVKKKETFTPRITSVEDDAMVDLAPAVYARSNEFPELIPPRHALPPELAELHRFLEARQSVPVHHQEYQLQELGNLTREDFDLRIRELENYNFRLNLEEATTVRACVETGFLNTVSTSDEVKVESSDTRQTKKPRRD